jgi:nitroreductase
MRVAAAQMRAGEVYWQSVTTTAVDISEAASDESLPIAIPMFEHLEDVPVVCVVAVDLNVVASMDQYLDRVGVVSGASIYPMAWNALMAARNEGFGGTLTTLLASQEPAVQELLGLESYEAVAAMLTIGRPAKQLSKLSRKPVEEFVFVDHANGEPLTA